jgi:hypothetical protein
MTTSIWARTLAALTSLGLPMAANTYVPETGSQIPDAYLVYFLVSSPPELAADNVEMLRSYRMQVSYYSRTGLAVLPGIKAAMVAAGFEADAMTELPFNPTTRHFGISFEFVYLEQE